MKCVTFAKHAQAVWGTIKGTITDQQDLKEQLDAKVNTTDVLKAASKVGFGLSGQTIRIINNYRIPLNGNEEQQDNFNLAITFPTWFKPESSNLGYNNTWGDISFDINTDLLPYEKADSGLTSTGLGGAVRELKGLIDDSNTEITKLQQNKVDKAMQELVQGIEPSTFNKGTGELTFNYDAFDVTTNSTTKKSIVISDMFKQEDLDNKVDYSNFSLPYASGTQANISLDSGSDRLNTVNINLSYIDINSKDFAAKDYTIFGLNSTNNTIKYSSSEQGFITLDVNTDNIKVNTPNEGTENQKDIITAVQDLYKLPRITSYQDLAGFEMKPGMITYNIDSINNLAYLVICKTAYTVAADNLDEDFNTNITNGNLVRIGIPNEII